MSSYPQEKLTGNGTEPNRCFFLESTEIRETDCLCRWPGVDRLKGSDLSFENFPVQLTLEVSGENWQKGGGVCVLNTTGGVLETSVCHKGWRRGRGVCQDC